ncbi:TIGR02186 family protein [Litoreibacter roseus]|uniref:Membrane protein n=1 Tax=Litoreibacter roseus TaxID=2601869 RepID=A0A6N6JDA8_9RHOB|nr:TIGR02186 family protein [Litoreibacter roseus]GFE63298.1 membrane protein [Litoreibacter roseus]
MRGLLSIFLLLASVTAAHPEEVVAGLSRDQVAITANFDGSDILVFGAVKREAPIPSSAPLQVIITVSGPKEPVTVRRKDRRLGIWVNTEAIEVDAAPSFYAVATTGPLDEVLTNTDDLRHTITIPRAIRVVGAATGGRSVQEFSDALVRIRQEANLYQQLEGAVNLFEETLFSTRIDLPANLVEGDYKTEIFLTRNGRVVDNHTTIIQVSKVGLERWIYNLAHDRPLIYGLLSLFIAISAGWLASAVFRYIRF